MNSPIIISSVNELVRVYPERIVYVSSDGNYSMMVLHDKTEHLFSFNLSHFQQILERQMKAEASVFIRIGKSRYIDMKPHNVLVEAGVRHYEDQTTDRTGNRHSYHQAWVGAEDRGCDIEVISRGES